MPPRPIALPVAERARLRVVEGGQHRLARVVLDGDAAVALDPLDKRREHREAVAGRGQLHAGAGVRAQLSGGGA